MSTTVVIGLGILAWALVAILLALSVGRMIRLRDRQRPDSTEPRTLAEGTPGSEIEALQTTSKWKLRNKTDTGTIRRSLATALTAPSTLPAIGQEEQP
jgi:hypothetical protein